MNFTFLLTVVGVISMFLGFQLNKKLLKKNKKRVKEVFTQLKHEVERIKSLESKLETLEHEKLQLKQQLASPGNDQQKLKAS